MRIAHVGKYYPPTVGGVEMFTRDLCVEQVRRGRSVAVLAHQETPGLPDAREMREGVEVERARIVGRLAHAPLGPGFGRALQRTLREFAPDITHLHLPNPAAVALLFCRTRPSALVIHWHADALAAATPGRGGLAMTLLAPFYRFAQTRLLRRADAIIVTSQALLDASPALAALRSICRVIPLGIDPARVRGAPCAPSLPSLPNVVDAGGRPLVLAVGRCAFYKGFGILIEAATRLPQADFCIVGQGPLSPTLREAVRRAGLDGRVLLPGQLDAAALATLYARCDVFCLPSVERSEAFGLVLLEAMACGKPLVATELPGSATNWVCQDGVNGLVARPGDPADLARVLSQLLDDPALRRRLGNAGKERFETLFRIEAVAAQIETVYAEATSKNQRERSEHVARPAA